ncbi:MAG: glycosyltransferase [Dehalococcoidia bacterium]|nr:MAG: glycosyltransferase [Dehalococcoidia bacterium]
MRVTFVSGEYPPDVGGVADYTYHLAHAVRGLGHEATVVTSGDARSNVDCVPVRRAPGWRLADVPSTARTIVDTRPDVVSFQYVPHMYGRGGVAAGAAALPWLLRRAGAPCVVSTMHEIASRWEARPRRTAAAFAHRAQAMLIAAASDRLVATNAAYARQLRRWTRGRRPVSEIPAGASILPARHGASGVATLRSSLGGDRQALVGEFSPFAVGKQPQALIALARQLGPVAQLVLIGGLRADDARRAAFERAAADAGVSDRITWTGQLSPSDVSRHLAALDLYVHTHIAGASPRSTTLVTALAHGLPIVAFDGPETGSSLRAAACLVPAGDVDALGRMAESMLEDPHARTEAGVRARDLHERGFRWDVIARTLMEALP